MKKLNFKSCLLVANIPILFLVSESLILWFFQNELSSKSSFQIKTLIEIGFSLVYFVFSLIYIKKMISGLEQSYQELVSQNQMILNNLSESKSSVETITHSTSSAAGSMEETVASLEELNSMVKLNSEHAKQAAALALNSRDTAENGEKEVTLLIQSMKDISDSSKKIQEITFLIDDISFQTNLLALNAAVEAARAGEQGRGFAVVADAVRNLAQKSALAAKDIGSLINDTSTKVEKGFSQANNSGEVLKKILTSVKMVSDLNNEISLASQEQTVGLNQISVAMNNIDQALQTNSTTMSTLKSQFESLEVNQMNSPSSRSLNIEDNSNLWIKSNSKVKTITSEGNPSLTSNSRSSSNFSSNSSLNSNSNTQAKSQSKSKSNSNSNSNLTNRKIEASTSTTKEKSLSKSDYNSNSTAPSRPIPNNVVPLKHKAEEIIPFDDDIDRTKLSKAEDF